MSSDVHRIRIGLTDNHPCSYLADKQERVAVALDKSMHTSESYEVLLANGFRRSGDTIYKPHCDTCASCHPIRISAADFKTSRSQKRVLNKAKSLSWSLKTEMDDEWFSVYSNYITQRHSDGTMFPPKKKEFSQFSRSAWLDTRFLHIYDHDKLIAIAVTDVMPSAASAFYTFFDPDYHSASIGTLAVLFQLEFCRQEGKQWLYLGYQIDECPAMNYKTRFHPHQRLVNQRWQG